MLFGIGLGGHHKTSIGKRMYSRVPNSWDLGENLEFQENVKIFLLLQIKVNIIEVPKQCVLVQNVEFWSKIVDFSKNWPWVLNFWSFSTWVLDFVKKKSGVNAYFEEFSYISILGDFGKVLSFLESPLSKRITKSEVGFFLFQCIRSRLPNTHDI